MRKVAVVAAGVTKFGVRQATFRDLAAEAGKAVFDNLGGALKPKDIDGIIVSTVMPERNAFQSHISSLVAEQIGIKPTSLSVRVEHMCASGNVAMRMAYAAIAMGMAEIVMVLGVEKLNTPVQAETFLNMMCGIDREWEGAFGLTAPPVFALAAQAHMRKYGTTEEQLAAVSMKNRRHACNNPNAQWQTPIDLAKYAAAKQISSPFKLFDCSSVADGAAAVIVTSEERARAITNKPMWILGSGQAITNFDVANAPNGDYSHWPALKMAAQTAYRTAGITAKDVDFAEVHDCFTIAEVIATEELGFVEKGNGGEFVASGRSDYGGDIVINPRGGLIGCGHPLGATGVAQAVECFQQLRGEAGLRQVKNARIGLAHTNSGMAEHTIVVYGRD
ncbi:MAG: beta-ketoacyl synthase N-terminal-like domain-containing protein [Desulfitobacteriaceae bacterium]